MAWTDFQRQKQRHGLTLLTRLAVRQPAASRWLAQALGSRLAVLAEVAVEVAAETGDPIAEALAGAAEDADVSVVRHLLDLCDAEPALRAVPLRELALQLNQQYLTFLLEASDRDRQEFRQETVRVNNNLALRFLELEHREEALLAARQAVTLSGELAEGESESEALRAACLINLGHILYENGQPSKALPAIQKAVELQRRLASGDDPTLLRRTASSLRNLGLVLNRLGRREEAVEACRESVDLRRRLLGEGHGAHAELAAALDGLGTTFIELGRPEEALRMLEEALAIRRDLAEAHPESYAPALAESLLNMGISLTAIGRRGRGLRLCREAVLSWEQLAARRDAFLPDLSHGLVTLAAELLAARELDEALAISRRAEVLCRQLVERMPQVFGEHLALCLHTLSVTLYQKGEREEALAAAREGVEIRKRLAAGGVSPDPLHFAQALDHLSGCLQENGRLREGRGAIEEAMRIFRADGEPSPAALPAMAVGFYSLAGHLIRSGRPEEALAPASEAVAIWRPLAARYPEAFQPFLAEGLGGLGAALGQCGRYEEAAEACRQAIRIFQELAAAMPDPALPGLARTLGQLSHPLLALGQVEEGLHAAMEGADLWRSLASEAPERFLSDLADSLNNLGSDINRLGRHREALPIVQETVEIYQGLFLKATAKIRPQLATALSNLGATWFDLGSPERGVPLLAEAVRTILPAYLDDPETFAHRTGPLARSYVRCARAAGFEPDADLLRPLAQLAEEFTLSDEESGSSGTAEQGSRAHLAGQPQPQSSRP